MQQHRQPAGRRRERKMEGCRCGEKSAQPAVTARLAKTEPWGELYSETLEEYRRAHAPEPKTFQERQREENMHAQW